MIFRIPTQAAPIGCTAAWIWALPPHREQLSLRRRGKDKAPGKRELLAATAEKSLCDGLAEAFAQAGVKLGSVVASRFSMIRLLPIWRKSRAELYFGIPGRGGALHSVGGGAGSI